MRVFSRIPLSGTALPDFAMTGQAVAASGADFVLRTRSLFSAFT